MGDAPFNGAGPRRLTTFPALEQRGVDEVPGHRDGSNDHGQRAGAAGRGAGQHRQAQGREGHADDLVKRHVDQFSFNALHGTLPLYCELEARSTGEGGER